MKTIHGEVPLNYGNGRPLNIINEQGTPCEISVIGVGKIEYLTFFICPHLYHLRLNWRIQQKITPENPRGFIYVQEIYDLSLTQKDVFIYNKFNKIVPVTGIQKNYGGFGDPNLISFIDQNLIIWP